MITLHLTGKLAEMFGNEVSLDARTPREAVIALSYQSIEYKEHLVTNDWHIFVGEGNDITESELDLNLGNLKDIYLVPRIEGANNGVGNFIVGAILVVVGYFVSIGTFGAGTVFGAPMIGMGVGLMVGGIIQMTTKVPGADKTSNDSKDDEASFLFNGPTNTASQGVAIPRGYGRMLTGSVVVSASLFAEAIPYVAPGQQKLDYTGMIEGWVNGDFN